MQSENRQEWDVAIIGGGPGGSTTGSLLKKYAPTLRVAIFEKERFPREHIGESQLPPISVVLDEMGCWEKVEAANFPVKIGATFRWGRTQEMWDFEFLPVADFKDEPRPAKYEGQRRMTAFQVDRAVYDEILLNHAAEMGCRVQQECQVAKVHREGDRVTGLELRSGEMVRARHYVDASGHVGILRRAMGVKTDMPTKLLNIAIWDYWENAEWAVEIGIGGTRIQVMSVDNGWLWFIPLGPTRTSLGFVCPAEYYKKSGKTPEELYYQALGQSERISKLITKATASGTIRTTRDWSFCAERTFGENWFLVGEAAGFADPILSAGLTLTHTGVRELAYSIIALDEGEHDAPWVKSSYDANQRARVMQHIRFADFWYASNGLFTDLKDHCKSIARDAGLRLTGQGAWAWLARGGFANDFLGQAGIGGVDLSAIKQITRLFTADDSEWTLNQYNVLSLNLAGATAGSVPSYHQGRIYPVPCYIRGEHRLALAGMYRVLVDLLEQTSDVGEIFTRLQSGFAAQFSGTNLKFAVNNALQCLEVMLKEGWVSGKLDKKKRRLQVTTPEKGQMIHDNIDDELNQQRLAARATQA